LINGFEQDQETLDNVERYKKDPPGIERSFFNRNADYWVRVDIRQNQLREGSIEVEIYNAYVGASPEVKPLLTKTADTIEVAIKKVAPNIKILRSEGLTGIPFI